MMCAAGMELKFIGTWKRYEKCNADGGLQCGSPGAEWCGKFKSRIYRLEILEAGQWAERTEYGKHCPSTERKGGLSRALAVDLGLSW